MLSFFQEMITGAETKKPIIACALTGFLNGGASLHLSQPIFLTFELSEIITICYPKLYENASFLTDLYVKKEWSLRRISREIGCSKNTVRRKLIKVGIEVKEHSVDEYRALKKKIKELKARGLSYQAIADLFNLWKVATRKGEGMWHAKTIRDIDLVAAN